MADQTNPQPQPQAQQVQVPIDDSELQNVYVNFEVDEATLAKLSAA